MSIKQFRGKKIKEVMGPSSEFDSYKVNEKKNLKDAASQLNQNRYHMLAVVKKNDIPVGLVTQTDIVKEIEQGKSLNPTQQVKTVMNRSFVSISEEQNVDDALSLMNSLNVNKLVVLESKGAFKGVIHKLDIISKAQELL